MSPTRRLPVYLLLESSGSMAGDRIESIRRSVRMLLDDAISDPFAVETVWFSVIAFADTARQIVPLTVVSAFEEPTLEASGGAALGAGLDLLHTCIDREVRKKSDEAKGDYKPLVFLLTDGRPTDDWVPAAARLKSSRIPVYACAVGPRTDLEVLQQVTDLPVIVLADLQPGTLSAFWQFTGQALPVESLKIEGGGGWELPPPPPDEGIVIVEGDPVQAPRGARASRPTATPGGAPEAPTRQVPSSPCPAVPPRRRASPAVWIFMERGARVGPVTAEEMRALRASGRIAAGTPVWRPGRKGWVAFARSELA